MKLLQATRRRPTPRPDETSHRLIRRWEIRYRGWLKTRAGKAETRAMLSSILSAVDAYTMVNVLGRGAA